MRILHLLGSKTYSGAEKIAALIMMALGTEHRMVYCSPEGNIRCFLEEQSIEYIPLKKRSYLEVLKVVRLFKPDIIHSHDYWASFVSSLIPGKFRLIVHLHNNYPWARQINIKTLAFLCPILRSCKIIGVSEEVLREHLFHRLIAKKSLILPNALDWHRIRRLSEEDNNEKIYDLLFVGRLHEQKDPLAFISVVAALSVTLPIISAAMIGEGPLSEVCRARVRELGIERNISFLGFLDNPYPFMKKARIVLMPSLWEGFGLVALEAMFLEVPVIARPAGGLKRIIEESRGGILCFSIEEFTEKAAELLRDPLARAEIGQRAKKWVEATSRCSTYVETIKSCYEQADRRIRNEPKRKMIEM